MYRGVYIARSDNTAYSAARTLVQVNIASTCAAILLKAYLRFNSVTSTAIRVRLSKRTTAGTGTSFTPIKLFGHPTALSSATHNHTAEGTVGDVIFDDFINYVSGHNDILIPETRTVLAPSERIAIDFPSAPAASVTLSAGMIFGEIG